MTLPISCCIYVSFLNEYNFTFPELPKYPLTVLIILKWSLLQMYSVLLYPTHSPFRMYYKQKDGCTELLTILAEFVA